MTKYLSYITDTFINPYILYHSMTSTHDQRVHAEAKDLVRGADTFGLLNLYLLLLLPSSPSGMFVRLVKHSGVNRLTKRGIKNGNYKLFSIS